jgi:RHH-type rel operon transcriptional repressor/antitoxin RelB
MTISVRLPAEYEEQLARLAAQTKRSKGFFIKEALAHYFEDPEDYYIATQRLSRPKRKTLSTAELLAALELKP